MSGLNLIDLGNRANDGRGDLLRSFCIKVQEMFDQIYDLFFVVKTKNYFYCTDTSTSALPTFRALKLNDIPTAGAFAGEFLVYVGGTWSYRNVFPTGVVLPRFGASGSGWLTTDGSLVSKTTYAGLYACIGSYYGGNLTQFNLPTFTQPYGLRTIPWKIKT